jgi:hypothetical protein
MPVSLMRRWTFDGGEIGTADLDISGAVEVDYEMWR